MRIDSYLARLFDYNPQDKIEQKLLLITKEMTDIKGSVLNKVVKKAKAQFADRAANFIKDSLFDNYKVPSQSKLN